MDREEVLFLLNEKFLTDPYPVFVRKAFPRIKAPWKINMEFETRSTRSAIAELRSGLKILRIFKQF